MVVSFVGVVLWCFCGGGGGVAVVLLRCCCGGV